MARLATECGVTLRTLHRIERGLTQPHRRTADAIRRVMEAAGVQFIDPDGIAGPGVRLASALPKPESGC